MTVIAWDGKTLAADRLMTNGHMRSTGTKIVRHDDHLLGIFGNMSMGMQLLNWFENGQVIEEFPIDNKSDEYRAGLVMVKPDGSIWQYEDTPFPMKIEDCFTAFGSGSEGALIAMECGCNARQAVELVSKYNITCGNGIDVLAL